MSVRYALLGLLHRKPRHGYELRAAFEAVVGGAQTWDVKPAQVYATLARLEESGWIEQVNRERQDGPEKRIYALTLLGEQALEAWFQEGVPPGHQRDEFFVKLMTALASEQVDPQQVIQIQRAFLFQEMHAATQVRDSYDPQTELAQILLLDKAIMHLEADLRWLDITETRLEEVQRQPLPEPVIRRRGRPPKGDKGSTYPPPEER